jgi:hypothetical protein
MNLNDPTAEELRLIAEAFRSEDEWSSRPRAVYTGEAMERELDELFPIDVGLEALRTRVNGNATIEAAIRVNEEVV